MELIESVERGQSESVQPHPGSQDPSPYQALTQVQQAGALPVAGALVVDGNPAQSSSVQPHPSSQKPSPYQVLSQVQQAGAGPAGALVVVVQSESRQPSPQPASQKPSPYQVLSQVQQAGADWALDSAQSAIRVASRAGRILDSVLGANQKRTLAGRGAPHWHTLGGRRRGVLDGLQHVENGAALSGQRAACLRVVRCIPVLPSDSIPLF